ncbi:MAG: AMP-binding protein [Acidobacteriia bacterium]|nr:AMP-binding protein [Terriglobia bacterium]
MSTFYDRFRKNAEHWPGNVAVEILRRDCVESYTYADLRRMAESIAHWLTQQAFKPGVRIAIFADNHPRWFATYLGIIAAGGVVVPLDTAFHSDQVAKLLNDSGSSWLFCDSKHLAVAQQAVNGSTIDIVVFDGPAASPDTEFPTEGKNTAPKTSLNRIFAAGSGDFVPAPCAGDTLAAILYTSGTTADPKGVMLSHANLIGEVQAALGWAPLGPSDSVLGVLPLFHVLAQITNFVVPLAVGARVVFLETLNSTELLRALSERKISAFSVVPQFFYLIHDRIVKEIAGRGRLARGVVVTLMGVTRVARSLGLNPGKVLFSKVHNLFGPNMRYLLSAGSRFDPQIARDFQSLGIDVLQAYGLTESTAACFATPPGKLVIGSVGQPLTGVEARIVDAQSQDGIPQPVGEIAVRGATMMQGYWNRPEATAAVLRDGWLHTGDLGYFDSGGNLFITGRKKEVIILSNGKNIYPEEVETYYLKSPFIKEICVIGLEGRPGDPASERLHGVVVPDFEELKKRKIVNAKEVLRFDIEGLSIQLPSTKRIGSYEIWQEELPRTTTRKIKRFEVEKRVRANHAREQAGVEPPVERPLSNSDAAWLQQPQVQRALAVVRDTNKSRPPTIRPDANLELDLGLDSMQRVELVAALEQEFCGHADESQVAEVYTVRQLVDLVLASADSSAARSDQAQSMAWHKILSEDPRDPEVLALARPRRIAEGLWYLLNRVVKLIAYGPFRLRVHGVEKVPRSGPLLICPNHQSLMDGVIMTSLLPWPVFREIFFVGTSEIFGSGFMRTLARWRRILVVDPDANLIPAMRAGAFGLRNHRVLVLYPEGERSIDGKPKSFKKGAAILSIHMQAPIVPVAIEGFHDAWPRGQRLPRVAPLQITFGDPIYPPAESAASDPAYEKLTAELRSKVFAMWDELQSTRRA